MKKPKAYSQSERAVRELRSLVLAGEFPPGSRLSEVAVSERLGISRTPLRQAMAQLMYEGLLDAIETGGYRIARLSMTDVEDAIELRGVLEGTAARMAAERRHDARALDPCRAVLDQLDTVVFGGEFEFEAYVRENAEFHRLLGQLAASPVIARELERVAQMPLASPSAFLSGQELIPDFRRSLELAQMQHRSIFEAIEAGEGTRAESLAREHARLARRNLDYVVRQKPNFVDLVPGLALIAS